MMERVKRAKAILPKTVSRLRSDVRMIRMAVNSK
jgi:hypothetical protein